MQENKKLQFVLMLTWSPRQTCSTILEKKTIQAGRPGGVAGYPRACYRSIAWVRVPPCARSHKSVGSFSCAQNDLRKA